METILLHLRIALTHPWSLLFWRKNKTIETKKTERGTEEEKETIRKREMIISEKQTS